MNAMTDPDDLRYPIGRFAPSASSLPDVRVAQIETLRLLPEDLKVAVSGLSESQMKTPYREGGWTVCQVVHHLADSHAMAYTRCKLALTEDWPTINPYDENAWASLADSNALPVDASLAMITAIHARWVILLESVTDEQLRRGYNHPQRGREMLVKMLAMYDWHSRHHTAHITGLRTRQGW